MVVLNVQLRVVKIATMNTMLRLEKEGLIGVGEKQRRRVVLGVLYLFKDGV